MDDLRNLNKKKLDKLLVNMDDAKMIEWLQLVGLLHKERTCPGKYGGGTCGNKMSEVVRQGNRVWRCGVDSCRKVIGFRVGTFFENQNVSFKNVCQQRISLPV
jgi:hypothetical protein